MRFILKDVEIKIPVLALLITGLVITAIIVVGTILIIKNNQIKQLKSKYETSKIANQLIVKQKTDTIEYYKKLIKDNSKLISDQKTLISQQSYRISTIKPIIEQYAHSQVFDPIQAYIEPKNDSLKFKLSGNQIKQVYREHLELLESRKGLIQYEELIEYMDNDIRLSNSQLSKQNELQEVTQSMLSECDSNNLELLKQLNITNKNRKFWKITTPISGVTGLIVGILLVR